MKDYLRKLGLHEDLGFYKRAAEFLVQKALGSEAEEVIGAKKPDRANTRTNQRNGTRKRTWDTRAGDIEFAIPKLRKGSYFPSILARRNMMEEA